MKADQATLAVDADCPFCLPREADNDHWLLIRALTASTLYLNRNQTYRGHAILVFDRRHVDGLEHLSAEEFGVYMQDFRRAAHATASVCQPDLMNYASLGNVVPHLHWHLVPRYRSDPRWGGPIYTTSEAEMLDQRLPDPELRQLAATIGLALDRA